jgi:hypothetical protein
VLTELAAGGLESDAAREFLERIPTPDQLMSPVSIGELEAATDAATRTRATSQADRRLDTEPHLHRRPIRPGHLQPLRGCAAPPVRRGPRQHLQAQPAVRRRVRAVHLLHPVGVGAHRLPHQPAAADRLPDRRPDIDLRARVCALESVAKLAKPWLALIWLVVLVALGSLAVDFLPDADFVKRMGAPPRNAFLYTGDGGRRGRRGCGRPAWLGERRSSDVKC